ncbi:M28 family peptidase [Mariniblastus fucicola]|uniref:Aminopeptidase S n=1 Tax=Mariniblastus fucicola TaxID=980251 RepID=A0A5B9PHJ0_9BACT|nr:M28 family peptidase [Mariniblastus fucicola]QEG24106.1 Aminopeptidase S [Mariniblastus fucicola]
MFRSGLVLFAITLFAVTTRCESVAQETNPKNSKANETVAADSAEDQIDFQASLKNHVEHLATTIGERNLQHHEALCEAADYVEAQLKSFKLTPTIQTFKVRGLDCHNIAVEIKGSKNPDQIVIVGAHYDSARGTPGANDNGSGTAALLVLAEHFSNSTPAFQPDRTLRFVAFTNEEPPYFQTRDEMGSWVYAESCRLEDQNIVAVISLETMGFYTEEANSQKYPPPLDRLYPSTGNFIGVVGNIGSGKLMRKFLKSFKANSDVPAEGASLPGTMPGVGWSDHWSFWQEGYEGLMITDTAPFRYPHYHRKTDSLDKINFPVFAKVVEGLVRPIEELVTQ